MNATQPGSQTSELLMAHRNKRAVFRDSGILILVTIQEIRITPARLRLRLESHEELMPDGRIKSPSGRTFTVSGIRENVTVQPHIWSSHRQNPPPSVPIKLNQTRSSQFIRVGPAVGSPSLP
jgi:hypothetical protein